MSGVILTALLSAGVLFLALPVSGLVPAAGSAVTTARGALAAIRDPELDEPSRERAVQAAAIRLAGLSVSLLLRGAAVLGAAFVPVLAADWAGVAPFSETLAFMARADVIVLVTAAIVLGYAVRLRLWSK